MLDSSEVNLIVFKVASITLVYLTEGVSISKSNLQSALWRVGLIWLF